LKAADKTDEAGSLSTSPSASVNVDGTAKLAMPELRTMCEYIDFAADSFVKKIRATRAKAVIPQRLNRKTKRCYSHVLTHSNRARLDSVERLLQRAQQRPARIRQSEPMMAFERQLAELSPDRAHLAAHGALHHEPLGCACEVAARTSCLERLQGIQPRHLSLQFSLLLLVLHRIGTAHRMNAEVFRLDGTSSASTFNAFRATALRVPV
jgi:hypothetical protein